MGFLKLSEVTPIPGVTSDTETGLVSPLLKGAKKVFVKGGIFGRDNVT